MSLWNSGPSLKSLLASRLSPAFIWIEQRTPLPPVTVLPGDTSWGSWRRKSIPTFFQRWLAASTRGLCLDHSSPCCVGILPPPVTAFEVHVHVLSQTFLFVWFFLSCKATFTGSKNYILRILFLCLFLFRLKKYLCSLYGRQPRLVWSGICIMTFIFLWFPAICIHTTFLFPYPTENILASISKM